MRLGRLLTMMGLLLSGVGLVIILFLGGFQSWSASLYTVDYFVALEKNGVIDTEQLAHYSGGKLTDGISLAEHVIRKFYGIRKAENAAMAIHVLTCVCLAAALLVDRPRGRSGRGSDAQRSAPRKLAHLPEPLQDDLDLSPRLLFSGDAREGGKHGINCGELDDYFR